VYTAKLFNHIPHGAILYVVTKQESVRTQPKPHIRYVREDCESENYNTVNCAKDISINEAQKVLYGI